MLLKGPLSTPYKDAVNAKALVLNCGMDIPVFSAPPCFTAAVDVHGSESVAIYEICKTSAAAWKAAAHSLYAW